MTNFRSVQDSNWIDCDDVTTLVGINESGKSNLLLALWKLNPVREGRIDILHDMPVTKLASMRENASKECFITAEFSIDQAAADNISCGAFCSVAPDTVVQVQRYYDGHYVVTFPEGMPKPTPTKRKKTGEATTDVNQPQFTEESLCKAIIQEMPKFVYYSNYGNLSSKIYLPNVIKWLNKEQVPGTELNEDQLRTLRVLFDFVRLDPQEIYELGKDPRVIAMERNRYQTAEPQQADIKKAQDDKEQRSILLQSASSDLTKKFKDWWKQGEYKFRFETDGDYFRIWVSDAIRTEEVGLDQRSTGLQWFLSFYLIFLVESQEAHKGAVLLLDEAGLTLHPLAQRDLVAFFDNLSQNNHIINTTHSPFVIDTANIDRCRVVYSDAQGFTVASSDLRQGSTELNERSIYAVHAALGLNVSDVLLQGCKPVIVEGPSDQHYLNGIKDYLIAHNQISPNFDIVFVPSGGVRGVQGIASLLAGKSEDLPVVLLDADKSGNGAANKLTSGLYKDAPERILSISQFTDLNSSEIEDLVPYSLLKRKIQSFFNSVEDEDFEEHHNESKPIIDQIEAFATANKVVLPKGYKVILAKAAKQALHKKTGADIPESFIKSWVNLFEAIINLQ